MNFIQSLKAKTILTSYYRGPLDVGPCVQPILVGGAANVRLTKAYCYSTFNANQTIKYFLVGHLVSAGTQHYEVKHLREYYAAADSVLVLNK